MTNPQSTIVLALLAALHGAAAVLFAPHTIIEMDSVWDWLNWTAAGVVLATPVTLAFWAVFGPGRLAVRLPATLWLLAAIYLLLAYGETRNFAATALIPIVFGGIAWFAAHALVQLPLWGLRAVRGWRLERVAAGPQTPVGEAKPAQFTLLAMLGWTFAAASIFGSLRWLAPVGELDDFGVTDSSSLLNAVSYIGLYSLVLAAAGLPVLAIAWIVLPTGRRLALRVALGAMTIAGIAGAAVLFSRLWGDGELAVLLVLLESGIVVSALLTTLAVAACGYRLRRRWETSITFSAAAESAATKNATAPPRRFALALAPLVAAAMAMACYAPYRFERWRQADETARWAVWGMQISFDDAGRISRLSYRGDGVLKPTDFERIADLSELQQLDFSNSRLNDAQLAQLTRLTPLTSLETLLLDRTLVSDAGLAHLVRFTKLKRLGLSGTNVTDAGLPRLAKLTELVELDLSLTEVTDEGLACVSRLRKLESIDLGLTAVTQAGAASLQAALPKARGTLGASDAMLSRVVVARITHRGALGSGIIHRDAKLKRLHARGPAVVMNPDKRGFAAGLGTVTDSGLAALSKQAELEELDLRDTAVTDAGLTRLSKLENLNRLDLRGTQVTAQGCENLARSLPGCQIVR